ncbi:MAG TPA: hypothetical protein PLR60_14715 [Syntrophorhabdaceae bacterium]|nr:hypothetical protein [Syntrophorhabdaceae bacterium]
MPKVAIDNLKPGMKTAKPVVNNNGMVLLGENTDLTAELIDRIRNMDVDGVYIQGTARPSKSKDEFLSEIEDRFRNVENDPRMEVIKRSIQIHIEGLYG